MGTRPDSFDLVRLLIFGMILAYCSETSARRSCTRQLPGAGGSATFCGP